MIDINKYEGHNTDDRIWQQYSRGLTSDYTDGRSRADKADARLAADAPLLLQTLKDLKEMLWCYFIDPECPETGVPYEKQIKEMLKIEY